MKLSAILGPYTFFFILYVHVAIFCAVCVYYTDDWLYSGFYHDIICSWTGNVAAAITVLYLLSFITSICMIFARKAPKYLFPIINVMITIALTVLTIVLGIRTRNGFNKDYETYSIKEKDPIYQNRFDTFKQNLCKEDFESEKCQRKITLYIHERSSQIGCYLLTLLLIFAGIQYILAVKMILYANKKEEKGLEDLSVNLIMS